MIKKLYQSITFFVYIFQIAIIIVGLIFRFIKEKQTIKNLLVPYGFIFTLKSYYKDLKLNYTFVANTIILNRALTVNKNG